MATPIPCDNQHGVKCNFLIQDTETGDSVALCAACFPDAVEEMAKMIRGLLAQNSGPETEDEPTPEEDTTPAETPAPFSEPAQAEPQPEEGADNLPKAPAEEPEPEHVG